MTIVVETVIVANTLFCTKCRRRRKHHNCTKLFLCQTRITNLPSVLGVLRGGGGGSSRWGRTSCVGSSLRRFSVEVDTAILTDESEFAPVEGVDDDPLCCPGGGEAYATSGCGKIGLGVSCTGVGGSTGLIAGITPTDIELILGVTARGLCEKRIS